MRQKQPLSDNIRYRIRLLILSRLFVVTFLLGITVFVGVDSPRGLSDISASIFLLTLLSVYFFSALYIAFFYFIRDIDLYIYIQSIVDVLTITAMVYGTGGIQSLYSVFYPVVIIYPVIFLGKRGGLFIASTASIFYGILAVLEYHNIIYPLLPLPLNNYQPDAGYVISRIVTHVLSFYFTAFLSIYVVGQERKTRTLLAEKQDAFARLDILYKNIIESVNAGIITINIEGRIKSFNRSASVITGFTFNEVENRKFSEIFPDFYHFLEQQKRMDERFAALTQLECEFQTGKGRNVKVYASVSLLRDPYGDAIGEIIIFEDIAELIEMRKSMEKNRRLAFTGELAAKLAHEIRNPLAAIGGAIQLLKKDIPLLHGDQILFDIIVRGKEQLDAFLRDFLLLARPAPGVCEELDLKKILTDVVEALRLSPDWNTSLFLHITFPEYDIILNINKTELRQVLWNVILNALQAMPEGGDLTVEAKVVSLKNVKVVQLIISDTGRGIEKKDLQRIFDPFYTTRSVGTGLGLAVVSRIIENWKGTIDIQSEIGRGTTLTIVFPLHGHIVKRSSRFERH